MTSRQTYNRQAKIQALKRMFIMIYNLLHLPYNEIDKIPMKFLLNMELELKKYAPEKNISDRYMHQPHLSVRKDDGLKHCHSKSGVSIKSRFDEVFK
jgi:hypothetical protein